MTILLYEYQELEDRPSRHLRIWKAWHTILYILAAIFGIVNYTFLQNTKELINNNCVFYPRELQFHWVVLSDLEDATKDGTDVNITSDTNTTISTTTNKPLDNTTTTPDNVTKTPDVLNITETGDKNETETAQPTVAVPSGDKETAKVTREVATTDPEHEFVTKTNVTTIDETNATIITENATHRLMLDTSRTLFAKDEDCDFAEYMPLLSTVFASVWATLFIMCPGGGRSSSSTGLQQAWRILAPALLFALVLVGLTGHSFTTTNSGLHAFCAAFSNLTNATTCSSVNPYVEGAWNASWDLAGRVAATRAAAAGVWASWACVAALLLARCVAAPDFVVRRTAVSLIKDPHQKVMPYLSKSPRHSQRSAQGSPTKRDNVSVRSESTITTELVTASVENGPDSSLPSLAASPARKETTGESIEMAHNPQELKHIQGQNVAEL